MENMVAIKPLDWNPIQGHGYIFWTAPNPFGGLPYEAINEEQKANKEKEYRDIVLSTLENPELTYREKALRSALEDLTSWFDGGPTRWGPWIIDAGEYGADAAVESARTILEATKENLK